MSKAIVIGTYGGREEWLSDCLNSLKNYTRFPVIAVNVPWELNVIKWAYEETNLSEFLFLQDTIVVKGYEWIDTVFNYKGSVSLCQVPFYMYLGKYTRKDLDGMNFPPVRTKREAVNNEGKWTSLYNLAPNIEYMWNLAEEERYEERHGRKNKVYENDYIIKYKGTWDPSMVPND